MLICQRCKHTIRTECNHTSNGRPTVYRTTDSWNMLPFITFIPRLYDILSIRIFQHCVELFPNHTDRFCFCPERVWKWFGQAVSPHPISPLPAALCPFLASVEAAHLPVKWKSSTIQSCLESHKICHRFRSELELVVVWRVYLYKLQEKIVYNRLCKIVFFNLI